MSLDNFQLSPFLASQLYKHSLNDLDDHQLKNKFVNDEGLTYFGKNLKKILVVLNDPQAENLAKGDVVFLKGILSACKLSMADIALINTIGNPPFNYKMLVKSFTPEVILCLGINISALEFPLEFPDYQVQRYNNQAYLSAPSLQILAADKNEKMQLWNCLKNIFSIN